LNDKYLFHGLDNQVKGGSSRNHSSRHDNSRQSSSRKSLSSNGSRRSDRDGMEKSRDYANFGRNKEKDREKEFNSCSRGSRPVAADHDGFQSFRTCRPERDRLNRARLKADRNKGVPINLNNDTTSRSNADVSSSKSNDIIGICESSTPVSTAAVSTSQSNAPVSASLRTAAVSTSLSTAGVSTTLSTAVVSTSLSTASVSTFVSTAIVSTSVITAADASRSSATLSTTRSNTALGISRSNAAMSTSRSNSALSTSRSNVVASTPRSNAAGMDFEWEFPQLSLEDKNGRQGISRVPSLGISTPIQNIPMINTSDGWNSVLADLPLLKDAKKSQAASSVLLSAPSKQTEAVSNSGTTLSMAETVMQAPPKISIGSQVGATMCSFYLICSI
jgi:hypothetical protein